jgi:hypothetical protein
MPHVEAVSGAGVIHVKARIPFDGPVVGLVVDAFQAEHRAKVVSFARVVVHDVENHLEAGGVQRFHHLLEFTDLPSCVTRR